MIAGENFFFSTFTASGGDAAEVGIAPKLQGEVAVIDCDGRNGWVCAGGSYLGSSPMLNVEHAVPGTPRSPLRRIALIPVGRGRRPAGG